MADMIPTSVKLDARTRKRADNLVPFLEARRGGEATSRGTVLRSAILLGLTQLESQQPPEGTPD